MYLCLLARQNEPKTFTESELEKNIGSVSTKLSVISSGDTDLLQHITLSPTNSIVSSYWQFNSFPETFDNKTRFRLTSNRWEVIFRHWVFLHESLIFYDNPLFLVQKYTFHDDCHKACFILYRKNTVYMTVRRWRRKLLFVNFLPNDWTFFFLLWNANILNWRSESDHIFVSLEN